MNIRLIGATALLASLAAAGCATTAPGYGPGYQSGYGPAPSNTTCYDCGTVSRIEVSSASASNVPNATGAVLGGLVTQNDLGGIREGSYVRVTNGRAYLR